MLQETWPNFLDCLDSDPKRAGTEFSHYALKFFEGFRPKFLTWFAPSEREDIQQEIIMHCINNDFRVLRLYRRQTSSFAAWFLVTAGNKAGDLLRMKNRRPTNSSFDNDSDGHHSAPEHVYRRTPESEFTQRQYLEKVNQLIAGLNKYCQLLLRLDGDEFAPKEIARVLRWPPQKSKKISDDLGYCRDKLLSLIKKQGLDVSRPF